MRSLLSPWKLVLYPGLALLLAIAAFALQLLYSAGQFKKLEPHGPQNCRRVIGIPGAEDITIHPRTGIAYISAADRRAQLAGGEPAGGIYAYDLTLEEPVFETLTPDAGKTFHPHGISLHRGGEDGDSLYVINHASGVHSIEVYDVVGNGLQHRQSLSDPLLITPNDLVAVGRDRLYITNDHAYAAGLSRALEDYLQRSISTLVYFDGAHFAGAATGVRYPNGINVSADGEELYVASTTGGSLLRYAIEPDSGVLRYLESVDMGTGVDNIEIDDAGNLWIGAHPKLLSFVEYAAESRPISPTQVLRVSLSADTAPRVEEILLSLGDDLSGSSVAAVYGDRLLVGSVMDDGILDCRLE